jgi:HSP20 family protein
MMLDQLITPMWSWSPRMATAPSWPVFDVAHTDDAVVITADVPGLGDDDVDVTLAGRTLTIEGRSERRGYLRTFRREFTLADGFDVDRLEASLERGVLSVYVPKLETAKPRKIQIGSTGIFDKVKTFLTGGKDESEKS